MKLIVMMIFMITLLVLPQFQTEVEAADQYACVKKNNGQFRIVDSPEDCNPSEFSVVIDVAADSEITGELCWTNAAEDCTLKLKFKSQGTSYSLIGNEICNSDTSTTDKHVYGSGYENNDELKIGLTFTGLAGETHIVHEGKVFAMDLASGFSLVQYRESNDPEECGVNPVPCIIQDTYAPIACP